MAASGPDAYSVANQDAVFVNKGGAVFVKFVSSFSECAKLLFRKSGYEGMKMHAKDPMKSA